ncbi:hypothetical protein F4778DRAFT_749388 [Xylariomycetidae sp. FL2044]|nr:hypothetical protein F4778DRAFT_749388 [Xylariomycetidae sp. FL2044]
MAYAPVHDRIYEINQAGAFTSENGSAYTSHQQNSEGFAMSPESYISSSHDGHKRYADVDLREVNPYWSVPVPVHGPSSHQRGWSDSTISTERPIGKIPPKSYSSLSKKASLFSTDGTWTLEIVTIVIAFAAVGSIMGVLARFDGHALPEWPFYITLNALIALLATITTATMSISLQNGISQLKWIRFKESRAPLTDMETFDEASRGTWGALKLLIKARGGVLGSFGATIAIVALALGPFAQQIVTYQTRSVESLEGAQVNRALNYTGALKGTTSPTGFVPLLPLKSAVYNGLFAENGRPGAALAFECQSGNCTWNPYETLGVCYECVDLTPFIEQYCAPDAEPGTCGWQVGQGGKLNNSKEVFSMTSHIPSAGGDMAHSTIMKLIFMGTEAHDGLAGDIRPWARQCSLSACLQTLESNVTNGVLSESLVSSQVNNTVLDITAQDGQDNNIYVAGRDGATYLLGIEPMLSMRGWFSSLFATGSASRTATNFNRTITDNAVVVNLTVGISSGETFFDSDIVTAFYWNYYEYADGLDMLMSDMATSMTVAFRSFIGAEPVSGRAISFESYVHVRWGFAVLPIVVVACTALFLVAAVYRTRRSQTKTWKSSALAMLFHGLDSDIRAQFDCSATLRDKKRQARDVRVQLDETSESGSLLRA